MRRRILTEGSFPDQMSRLMLTVERPSTVAASFRLSRRRPWPGEVFGGTPGLVVLGLLPSNYLSWLQFESSTGVRVPNFVPDGLYWACPGLQVEDGVPNWGIPRGSQEVCPGSHRVRLAGRGHLAEPWFFDSRHRGDGQELTTIRLTG
jgi:hypothetical protein